MSREVVLAARPQGAPVETDFEVRDVDHTEPADGETLVRNVFVSVDPYMRGRMTGVETYVAAVRGRHVDRRRRGRAVVASRDQRLAEGDWVHLPARVV